MTPAQFHSEYVASDQYVVVLVVVLAVLVLVFLICTIVLANKPTALYIRQP